MAEIVVSDVGGSVARRPLTVAEQEQRAQDIAAADAERAAEQEHEAEQEDSRTQLDAVRAKAKQVASGDGTFTAAQVQKILAHLILRTTR